MSFVDKYIETDRNFYKRLLTIAVPVIVQSLITTGVNLVDNIMLGQLTETALSASTQANQFLMLFNGIKAMSCCWRQRTASGSRMRRNLYRFLVRSPNTVRFWGCHLAANHAIIIPEVTIP